MVWSDKDLGNYLIDLSNESICKVLLVLSCVLPSDRDSQRSIDIQPWRGIKLKLDIVAHKGNAAEIIANKII